MSFIWSKNLKKYEFFKGGAIKQRDAIFSNLRNFTSLLL